MRKIEIVTDRVKMKAEFNESDTASKIYNSLPLESSVRTWGDEIYFEIPVDAEPENPKETVELGDLAYWPQGGGFCIFFGKTPVSRGDEIRPASAVNPVGKLEGDPKRFKEVSDGDKIKIKKAD